MPTSSAPNKFYCNLYEVICYADWPNGAIYTWLRAIVNPIPKSAGKYTYVPSNYRGISLLSCLSKTYTYFIHERITKYCEINDILVDEWVR